MTIDSLEEEQVRAAIATYRTLAEHYGAIAERLAKENIRLKEEGHNARATALQCARLSLESGALRTRVAELEKGAR